MGLSANAPTEVGLPFAERPLQLFARLAFAKPRFSGLVLVLPTQVRHYSNGH